MQRLSDRSYTRTHQPGCFVSCPRLVAYRESFRRASQFGAERNRLTSRHRHQAFDPWDIDPVLMPPYFEFTADEDDSHPHVVVHDVMMPMRDGVRLASTVYRPSFGGGVPVPEPLPVVFHRTPYDKDKSARTERCLLPDGTLSEPIDNPHTADRFARRGYVVVIQDCRGRYQSEGRFTKYVNEGDDGEDALEWITDQPWCNGKVGTFGLSYCAHVQLAMACKNPIGLAAMFLESGGFWDAYQDGVRYGGAFTMKQVTWAFKNAKVSPEVAGDARVRAAMEAINLHDWFTRVHEWFPGHSPLSLAPDYESYIFHDWFAQCDGEEWQQVGLCARRFLPQMADVPTLIICSWYDPYVGAMSHLFNGLMAAKHSEVRMVLGPWTHGDHALTYAGDVDFGPQCTFDRNVAPTFQAARAAWFDEFLHGRPPGGSPTPGNSPLPGGSPVLGSSPQPGLSPLPGMSPVPGTSPPPEPASPSPRSSGPGDAREALDGAHGAARGHVALPPLQPSISPTHLMNSLTTLIASQNQSQSAHASDTAPPTVNTQHHNQEQQSQVPDKTSLTINTQPTEPEVASPSHPNSSSLNGEVTALNSGAPSSNGDGLVCNGGGHTSVASTGSPLASNNIDTSLSLASGASLLTHAMLHSPTWSDSGTSPFSAHAMLPPRAHSAIANRPPGAAVTRWSETAGGPPRIKPGRASDGAAAVLVVGNSTGSASGTPRPVLSVDAQQLAFFRPSLELAVAASAHAGGAAMIPGTVGAGTGTGAGAGHENPAVHRSPGSRGNSFIGGSRPGSVASGGSILNAINMNQLNLNANNNGNNTNASNTNNTNNASTSNPNNVNFSQISVNTTTANQDAGTATLVASPAVSPAAAAAAAAAFAGSQPSRVVMGTSPSPPTSCIPGTSPVSRADILSAAWATKGIKGVLGGSPPPSFSGMVKPGARPGAIPAVAQFAPSVSSSAPWHQPMPPVKYFRMGGGSGARMATGRLDHGGEWLSCKEWPPAWARQPAVYTLMHKGLLKEEASSRTGHGIAEEGGDSGGTTARGSEAADDNGDPASGTAEEAQGSAAAAGGSGSDGDGGAASGQRQEVVILPHDPLAPVPTIGGNLTSGEPIMTGGAFDQVERPQFFGCQPEHTGRRLCDHPAVASWATPSLTCDLELTGTVRCVVTVSSDAPDADIHVTLVDEYPVSEDYPNGFSINIASGVARARFRQGSLPHDVCWLRPGQPTPISVELNVSSNLFAKGHRLRLDISASSFPRYDINYGVTDEEHTAWMHAHGLQHQEAAGRAATTTMPSAHTTMPSAPSLSCFLDMARQGGVENDTAQDTGDDEGTGSDQGDGGEGVKARYAPLLHAPLSDDTRAALEARQQAAHWQEPGRAPGEVHGRPYRRCTHRIHVGSGSYVELPVRKLDGEGGDGQVGGSSTPLIPFSPIWLQRRPTWSR